MLFSLLIFLLLPVLSLSTQFNAEPNICFNVTRERLELPSIKLPTKFKLAFLFTDWLRNRTEKFFEARIDFKQAVVQSKYHWVDIGEHKVLIDTNKFSQFPTRCFITRTADEIYMFSKQVCIMQNGRYSEEYFDPLEIPSQFDFLSFKNSSVLDFLTDFLGKKLTGVIKGVNVQSGAEGVRWVSCQPQNAIASVAGASIEVVYAGEDSILPPSSAFSNPTILALTLTSYVNISDANSNIDARVSLHMEPFDDVKESDPIFQTEAGIYCEILPTIPFLPLKFPTTFAAKVTYDDIFQKSHNLTLVYDSAKRITADDVAEGWARNFNERGLSSDATQVVHDIGRGLEYVRSPSGCRISALPTNTRDLSANGTAIASPYDLFITGLSHRNFSFYYNVIIGGRPCRVYRAATFHYVMEVHIDDDGSLVAIDLYIDNHREHEHIHSFTSRYYVYPVETVSLISSLHDCFNVSKNSTFSVIVPGKSVATVSALSSTVVSDAFGSSFSALLPRFSPHRFRFFFSDEKDALRVIFSIADPAMVSGRMENSTEEFIKALEKTLFTNGLTVRMVGMDGKKQKWRVAKSSLIPYSSNDSAPTRYTGGSILVLSIFMMLFGIVFGSGGVYAVHRRSRISHFAYQLWRRGSDENENVEVETRESLVRDLRETAETDV